MTVASTVFLPTPGRSGGALPASPRRVPAEACRAPRRRRRGATPSTRNSTRVGLPATSTRQSTRPVTSCPSATLWLRIVSGGDRGRLRLHDDALRGDERDPPLRDAPVDRGGDDLQHVLAGLGARRVPGEEERRPPVDGAAAAVDEERHRRGLRAPRAHAQLHRSAHLRPRAGAGARQRERLVVDDDRPARDVVAAGPGDAVHLEHVRAVAELRRVQAAGEREGRAPVGRRRRGRRSRTRRGRCRRLPSRARGRCRAAGPGGTTGSTLSFWAPA